jgi:modulator of FtsH protease HflC
MNRKSIAVIIGVLLLLLFGMLLFVFQVRTSEVAVVTRFGKPDRRITAPGAQWRLPWPIEKVYKFDQRIQNFAQDQFTEGLTQDNFSLLSMVYVGWRITEITNFFPKFTGAADPMTEAEGVILRTVANARSSVVSKHPLSDFLSASGEQNKFAQIEKEIFDLAQSEVVAHNYGIEIKFLGFKKLGFPETVTQSVFERMTSERQVLASRSQYEGERDAQKIRSEADSKAATLLAAAGGEATKIRAKGEAEAANYLKVFDQKPELAALIFRLNALEASLKDRSVLIFDQQTPPFDLFRSGTNNLLHP